jgi:hypothetical protein
MLQFSLESAMTCFRLVWVAIAETKRVLMQVKIEYSLNGQPVSDIATVENFPPGVWAKKKWTLLHRKSNQSSLADELNTTQERHARARACTHSNTHTITTHTYTHTYTLSHTHKNTHTHTLTHAAQKKKKVTLGHKKGGGGDTDHSWVNIWCIQTEKHARL